MALYKNIGKKILLLSLSLLIFLPFSSIEAQTSPTSPEYLLRQIEYLKWDISVLQELISDLKSNRTEIYAASYLAVDLSTGNILLEKNSETTYPIASITKLMNAVVALENVDIEEKIILQESMLEPFGYSPCLFNGLNISGKNLLRASLTQSVNDAAEAISYFIGKEKFIELMNFKAKEIGMTDTVFLDSHGLNSNNLSTAADLVKLLEYIFENHPEILNITKDNNFWLADKSGTLFKFRNVNNFYLLPDFIGGKTGYLPEAGQTLASIFEIDNRPIAVIVLNSTNRRADVFAILSLLK